MRERGLNRAADAATQRNAPVSPLLHAASYAELLGPESDASALLAADDARSQQGGVRIQLAQDHHHHHHTKIIIKKHHHHHRKIIIKKTRSRAVARLLVVAWRR